MLPTDFGRLKEFDNHKLVLKIEDKEAGLKGFIAIHNDRLGRPSVGGTRMFPYASEEAALVDVLKLSRAMTYKCAISKVPHGGAKGVIIGDPKKHKTAKLLKAYAEKVDSLKGDFCTGEDVGISESDVKTMLRYSKYFIGKPGLAQDPSPYAALSTLCAMKGAVFFILKKKNLQGIKVAIKGVGKVGGELARLLSQERAEVFVSDIDKAAIDRVKKLVPGVTVVDNSKILSLDVDVFSPCALGGDISMETAPSIKAKIICGAANNQLADQDVGDWLFRHEITYVPDYVANAGGLINVVDELEKSGYNKSRVEKRTKAVEATVKEILALSKKMNKSTHRVSDQIAESRFLS